MGSEPYFSVIIPTFERAEELSRLLSALEKQTMTEFEVIIVDQSKDASDASGYDLNIEYCHTDVRGAVQCKKTTARHSLPQNISLSLTTIAFRT